MGVIACCVCGWWGLFAFVCLLYLLVVVLYILFILSLMTKNNETAITQFHIGIDSDGTIISLDGITNLGSFSRRDIIIDIKDNDDVVSSNELAEDLPEFARVVDLHEDGDICSETNEARKTYLQYQCCSSKVIQRHKGMLHKAGKQVLADIAAVVDVIEDKQCTYNVTVCTPLLCGEDDDEDDIPSKDNAVTPSSKAKKDTVVHQRKENETIHEILDRSFGIACIQAMIGGWWTYEICHKDKIRQYHEEAGTKRTETGATFVSKVVTEQHILGKYKNNDEIYPSPSWGDEWSIVVNSTDKHSSIDGSGGGAGVGVGTYYEVEYTGGDFCDTEDVKDSAIVAGAIGSQRLARASSVRYFCGPYFAFTVDEDSSCHYIVQVSVPDLCFHPLFREPVSKKQVIKCLPADM